MRSKLKRGRWILVFGILLSVLVYGLPAAAQIAPSKEIPDNFVLVDGDMLIPKEMLNGFTPNATFQTNFWTVGLIRFEFNTNVTTANRFRMTTAMAVLEDIANIDFVNCNLNNCSGFANYVHIQDSTVNQSAIGMVGGRQIINIFNWETQYIIIHELLHCLGFLHEHIRPDRNSFIRVNCAAPPNPCNIQGGFNGANYNDNFAVAVGATVFGNYDFDSLMHYDQCGFSTDCPAGATCACTNTVFDVIGTAPPGITIGQRDHLSVLDAATLSYVYPASNMRFMDCGYAGVNGPPNGTFRQPFATFAAALASVPVDGTIIVMNDCLLPVANYTRSVKIIGAPGRTSVFPGMLKQ